MRGVVFGDEQGAASELIQAVHDARAKLAAERGKQIAARLEPVHERGLFDACGGVDGKARGLIYHEQIIILV